MTDEAKPTVGIAGIATLALWLLAMLGVLVLIAAPFDAPHQREGGVAAAMMVLAIFVATGAGILVSLIAAGMHWGRHRSVLVPRVMTGSLLGALLIGGGLRLSDQADRNDEAPPLHTACMNRDLEEARRLIEGGADVNERDASGETPALSRLVARDAPPVRGTRPGRRPGTSGARIPDRRRSPPRATCRALPPRPPG